MARSSKNQAQKHNSKSNPGLKKLDVLVGKWEMWRDAPGFLQRFTGSFSNNGNSITGHWEKSGDGSNWERDFDLTYTKIG